MAEPDDDQQRDELAWGNPPGGFREADEEGSPSHSTDRTHTNVSAAPSLEESRRRFAAGTTYGDSAQGAAGPPAAPTPLAPHVMPIQSSMPVVPVAPAGPLGFGPRQPTQVAPDLDFLPVLTFVLAVIFPPLAIPVGLAGKAHFGPSDSRSVLMYRAVLAACVSTGLFGLLALVTLMTPTI